MASALFSEQKKLGEEIDRAGRNYGKDGEGRKNSVDYFNKKIDSIKTLFSEFTDNHKEIETAFKDKVQDHDYFVNSYFAKISELYATVLSKMENDFKSFSDSLGNNAELAEIVSNKDFAKRMLTLLSDRIKNCPNVDLKTWKFNLTRADRYWFDYNQCKEKLEAVTTEQNDFSDEASELHDVHQAIVVTIEEKIATAEELEERDHDHDSFAHPDLNRTMIQINESLRHFSSRNSNRVSQDDVKLPRIQIPKFDGSFNKWPEFRDLFIALVHSKKNLPNVQKMQYLKSNLEAGAADIIRHLQITDLNYETAWTLIEKRFNNKKMLITNYLNRLFNLPIIHAEESDSLKKLLDGTKEILMSLQHLGEATDQWGSIIVFILTQRLPPETFRLWEESCEEETSNVAKLEKFIETRFRTLENLEMKQSLSNEKIANNDVQVTTNKPAKVFNAIVEKCGLCTGNKNHKTFKCYTFKYATPEKRVELIQNAKLCALCLGKHSINVCTSTWKCYLCQGRHNTSLHVIPNAETTASSNNCINESHSDVLLATAVVKINKCKLRALVDQGSTVSFISESAVQALKLIRSKESLCVLGVAGTTNTNIRGSVTFSIQPHFPSDFKYTIKAYILQTVSAVAPSEPIKSNVFDRYQDLKLADPSFHTPNRIDILLGADVLAAITLKGVICGQPLAQETTLGWVISGKAGPSTPVKTGVCLTASLNEQVEKFWKIEELSDHPIWNEEEIAAECDYSRNHSRDEHGRYIVKLPFKAGKQPLGRSRNIAVANLLQLEKKFKRDPVFKARYVAAMKEYFDKHYAEPVKKPESHYLVRNGDNRSYGCFYMPHLAVIKESSASTKTRIVFDASRKSMNGISLNDVLMTGPTIQSDIVEKLLNFRKHKYAFTCDAEKMYLQIRMHQSHLPYQRFVWRENENEEIADFCLNTVVFGQSSAPFLAIRTFQQIALDNQSKFPLGAGALENEFYVDDLLAGEDSIDKAINKKNELIQILGSAGIKLRKWASNEETIIADITSVDRESGTQINVDIDTKVVKTLGIYWDNKSDTFKYKIAPCSIENEHFTKRKILSESAKLFDPIGWVQPIIIVAKILLQELWENEVGWDDKLGEEFQKEWSSYRLNLHEISKIELPRWIGISEHSIERFEIHVFADASEKAYGAVAYLKNNSSHKVYILMAKSRVAPLKKKTLARLELCAALVAVNLIQKIKKTLPMQNCIVYGWSDSTITLAWINKPPNTWKTFVCQRVSQIQEVIDKDHWNHVKSAENPADLISRGCEAKALRHSDLWWHGPQWLASWTKPTTNLFETTEEMSKSQNLLNYNSIPSKESPMIDNSVMHLLILKISSFNRLVGAVAWTRRAINAFKMPKNKPEVSLKLTALEKEDAHTLIIKLVQNEAFGSEIEQLKDGKLKSGSVLRKVDAWLDGNGILRVGGRLAHADLPFDQKHPQLLPYKHHLTRVIIRMVHKDECFHAGNRATLASIRQKYWIIKGNSAVKNELQNCTVCKRFRAQVCTQLMGQLPSARVTAHKPFSHTGCDLAGPILIKSAKGRGIRTTKGYIVIFVCMSTKAIHIELVSDLTSSSFIAALKRFISRRGCVSELYSDNGTNFVGANNVLIRESMKCDVEIQNFVDEKKIQWHFLPPYSPHMGGLWEAGVKSIKHHLNRILLGEKLTVEEMNTVLCQIESSLNSRPLLPISENIDDLEVLTPGHFLIGRALTSPVERSYLDSNPNHLTRWQRCSQLFQTFWSKWKTDYLNQIRQRSKWYQTKNNLSVGDVVVIKEDNAPPNQWKMGRVTVIYPGIDGLVRTVSLKTEKGTVKRNITRLISLSACRETPPTELKPTNADSENDLASSQSARKQRLDRRNQKKLSVSNTIIISILLNLLLVAMVFGNKTKLEKLNDQTPSIFFEEAGTVQYVSNYWDILITHNKSHYDQELQFVRSSANMVRSLCQNNSKHSHECRVHSRNLYKKLSKITNNNEYIGNPNNILKTGTQLRNKREVLTTLGLISLGAALGATGKYAYDKFLGHSDEYDQLYYNQEILQTHLINETSILNDSFHAFKAQGETIDANIIELYSIINNATTEIDKITFKQKLFSIMLDLSAKFDELIAYQERVINPKAHISEIIAADQMQTILNHIEERAQSDDALPSFRAMYEVWHTAAITSHITIEQIIFNVKIPLVSKCTYTLYQKHMLPVVRPNNKMVVIRDAYDYYAVDCHKNTVSLTSDYISHCSRQAIYICANNIKNEKSNPCDDSWFSKTGESSLVQCIVAEIPTENIWIPTNQGLLFSLSNDTSINIHCSNASWEIQVPRVGLLKTDNDCKILWANNTLRSGDEIIINNALFATIPTTLRKIHSKKFYPLELPQQKETLLAIENRIEKLKNEEKRVSLHDIHHYSAPYFLFAIVLALFWYLKNARKREEPIKHIIDLKRIEITEINHENFIV